MKDNIIALPAGRIKKNSLVWERKKAKDPDLFVNMVEGNRGHIERRNARREAYYQMLLQEREDNDKLMQEVGTAAMFTMLAALLAIGLAL